MGTLTANQARLTDYCDHKLPTSCRLSSIPLCCACADERAHSVSYSTYIDGIGYVSRGTRWQRYCWFCKEFWATRVEASGLAPGQTRIPEVPDQSEFLRRWYEFHQGYRTIESEDGTEEKVAVLGEDFRDVGPGMLPRTLDEMRAGIQHTHMIERERLDSQRTIRPQEPQMQNSLSLEETLDQMVQAAESEEAHTERDNALSGMPAGTPATEQTSSVLNVRGQAMHQTASRSAEYQTRRIAALRRELHRMRHGIERVISGLRELGEDVPDHSYATVRLSELGRTLDTISGAPSRDNLEANANRVDAVVNAAAAGPSQTDRTLANLQDRVENARRQADEAQRGRDQAAAELDLADRELRSTQSRLRQLQTEQRTTENYIRLFGTREEMLAQGEDYESPIGGMFNRAWERFRVAEDVRREERNLRHVLEDETRIAGPGGRALVQRIAAMQALGRDVWSVPQRTPRTPNDPHAAQSSTPPESQPPGISDVIALEGMFGTPRTESDRRGEEVGLEQYYARLRRQHWSQQETQPRESRRESAVDVSAGQATGGQSHNHERSTGAEPSTSVSHGAFRPEREATPAHNVLAGPPGQPLDADPFANNDRGRDALHVLSTLLLHDSLREAIPWGTSQAILTRYRDRVVGNNLDWSDRENIWSLLELESIIWRTGLPAERNRRRRARGEDVTFTEDVCRMMEASIVTVHDIEIMAECFQMSSHVRMQSGLNVSEQLVMLSRLQRGERNEEDRAVLSSMLEDRSTLACAINVHAQQTSGTLTLDQDEVRDQLTHARRAAARSGDHSRSELNAQREAARALALAAGRTAMQSSPAALLEQMANRDDETRAAYQRLRDNGFDPAALPAPGRRRIYRPLTLGDFTASPSATDSEPESDDEATRGLDAKHTGRPEEPMTDEEMTMKLDCRICYSQMATIATVPCGHLAMCQWCSEQHSPTMTHDRTRPRRAANCPVCRKFIRQKIRVIRA